MGVIRKNGQIDKNNDLLINGSEFIRREGIRHDLFASIWGDLIPKVFNDVPKYYRLGNVVASLGLWELWVWEFVRTINLKPGFQVLDVCGGTNDVGIRLLRKEPRISVTAIDRSQEMQEEGQRRARKYGVEIKSVIQDVHKLPFPDASFDVVTLQAASRHLQLDKALPEILRVLKPGGHFYHCDMLRPNNPLMERLYLQFLRLSVGWTALIFGSTEVSRKCNSYFREAIANFYTPEELSDVFGIVGFKNIICRKSVWQGMVAFHDSKRP